LARDVSSVRLSRLNRLMLLFYQHARLSRKEIFREVGYASGRTFERDVEFLRDEYGVEIVYSRASRQYSMCSRGTFILNCTLDEREALALSAGLSMARHFLPHLGGTAGGLWGKLKALLPEELAQQGDELGRSAVVALPVSSVDPEIFEIVLDACRTSQVLELSYTSPYGDGLPRTHKVYPWGVFFRAHAWYLWAGNAQYPDTGTYRISRIDSARPAVNAPFVAPPEEEDLQSYASSAWYASAGKACEPVRIKALPPLSRVVAETVWHPSQQIEELDDGSIILSATVPDLDEVARWILASAPYALPVEPPELKERLVMTMEQLRGAL
jgi:predicted DNA-binding transcriptional regulator YafY